MEAVKPREERKIIACDALLKGELRGNRLATIGELLEITTNGARGCFQIDLTRGSGQPVGNCKT
jgi:hypothetical protein